MLPIKAVYNYIIARAFNDFNMILLQVCRKSGCIFFDFFLIFFQFTTDIIMLPSFGISGIQTRRGLDYYAGQLNLLSLDHWFHLKWDASGIGLFIFNIWFTDIAMPSALYMTCWELLNLLNLASFELTMQFLSGCIHFY